MKIKQKESTEAVKPTLSESHKTFDEVVAEAKGDPAPSPNESRRRGLLDAIGEYQKNHRKR